MGFSRFWASTSYTSTHMSVFLFIVTFLFIATPIRVTETECVYLVECELYEYDYICEGKFQPWAEVNCPSYCGFCSGIKQTLTRYK